MSTKLTFTPYQKTLRVRTSSKIVEIVIFDIDGSFVYKGSCTEINTTQLAKGTYLLSAKTEDGIIYDRFLIE